MAEPLDILDERDPFAFPFIGSLLVHGSVVALLLLGWYWMNRTRETFGEPNPAGGPAYAVSPVSKIPIPPRDTPPNPVAADTQSSVPTAPAKQQVEKKQPVPDKNAFDIADKRKRQDQRPMQQQKYMQPAPPNQVYSQTRTAVSSPMYGGQTGAGQVGIGPNSPLGTRLGAYAELVRTRIAQQWLTNGLDARTQSQPAILSFIIMRDGSIRNPQIIQTSGNPLIDNSALRAAYQSNPLPPLPPQVSENYISAQFTFNLR
ncbi:MAG: TonB family protein [Acidobacteriaceae bacterium]|nr:TonB family protein [Acidobacteriaceae bacterium]